MSTTMLIESQGLGLFKEAPYSQALILTLNRLAADTTES